MLKKKEILNECYFKMDSLFGITFAHDIERMLQTFLLKCMNRSSFVQIDPLFYDTSFMTSKVQQRLFIGMLPPCISDTKYTNIVTEEQPTSKKNSTKEDKHVKNNDSKLLL